MRLPIQAETQARRTMRLVLGARLGNAPIVGAIVDWLGSAEAEELALLERAISAAREAAR